MGASSVRGSGVAVVAVAFCVSFVVSVYHTWTHDAPLLATILGQWSLVALSMAYGTAGYHALRSVETASERDLVGLWSGIGYGLAGMASGLYALHQHLTPEAALPFDSILFHATFVALVGGTAGIFLGLERSRRKRIVADLEASAEELESIQADIRTEKRRFESLFQNSPSAIADLQYDGGEPTVERANTAFEDLLDGTGAAVEGRNLFDLVPLRDAATEDAVAAHVRGDERYEGEVTVDRSRGRRHYKLRVIPYEVGKAGERAFALYTDVTELRNTQKELEESVRRLEASNDRLERFAYAASHDLQEPLRTVSNYLRLIEDRYDDELDEDGREFVDYAVDAADRMREMIDGLLEYSRVETRGESFETVDLADVVDDACTDLAVKFEESDAEVAVDDLPRVTGDGDQLRQVFRTCSRTRSSTAATIPRG